MFCPCTKYQALQSLSNFTRLIPFEVFYPLKALFFKRKTAYIQTLQRLSFLLRLSQTVRLTDIETFYATTTS